MPSLSKNQVYAPAVRLRDGSGAGTIAMQKIGTRTIQTTRQSQRDTRSRLPVALSLIVISLAELLVAAEAMADDPVRANVGSRPNIVFLYTDDQAQWAMGAYGNRDIKTPNLDRLARSGAIFHNAFTVTPVCSPSRAALMTSRYASELGIADWIDPRNEPNLGLAPAAITWPELLRGFGYATMLAGKWHLGTRDEFHPTRQGFDRFFGFRDGSNRPIDPKLEVDGQLRQHKGSLPDLLVDEGLKFIEAHRDRPFLLSIHFRAPHKPYAPVPEQDSAPYRTLDPDNPRFPRASQRPGQADLLVIITPASARWTGMSDGCSPSSTSSSSRPAPS